MLAIRRIARAEASPSGGPQLTLLLGPAGFDPQKHFPPFTSSILSGSGRALRGWAKGPARRPGDPKGSQKQQSIHCPRLPCSACRPFVLGAPPRAANASLRPRTAILWNRAIRSRPIAVRRQRGVQRAPSSCSPPRGVGRTARLCEPQLHYLIRRPILRNAFSAAASGERIRSASGVFRPSASGGCGPTVGTGT